MAITRSAKKAHRASLHKKEFNDARRKTLREALKDARLATKGDAKALSAAYAAIDKAMKRGLMHKNTAARRKAKVAKALSTK